MRPSRTIAVPLAAAVVLLASCLSAPPQPALPTGGGAPGSAIPTAVASSVSSSTSPSRTRDFASLDACSILTRKDAETLIGSTLTEPLRNNSRDDASCVYPGDPNGPTAQVEIWLGQGAKKQLDIERSLDHEFTPVKGIGDEAWQEPSWIFARSGPDWLSVHVVSLSDESSFVTPLQTAMTTALSRF